MSALRIGGFQSVRWGQCLVDLNTYATNGALAVQLRHHNKDSGMEEPLAVLSVNLPQVTDGLEPGEFVLKDSDMYAALADEALRSGLFEDTGLTVPWTMVDGEHRLKVWRLRDCGPLERLQAAAPPRVRP
jgi:hypothetical protein